MSAFLGYMLKMYVRLSARDYIFSLCSCERMNIRICYSGRACPFVRVLGVL
jgi:hypothetical protein